MRKHFLILMLMSLLPLASWGSTLDPLGIQAKNINYGYIVTEDLTELLHSEIEGSLAHVNVDENVYTKSGNMYTAVCQKEGVKDLVVGTYYLKVTGKEGDPVYEGATDYLVFLVNPYDISEDATFTVTLTIPGAGYTYDGTAKNPTYAVAWTGHTLNTNDYEVATTDNVAAGTNTAKVTVTGKGNLTGTKTAKFSIAALEVNTTDFTITPNKTSFVYNSEVQKPTFTVKYGETVLEEDGETAKDYSIAWSGDSKNYGDYTATINFHGNFKDPDDLLAMQTQEYTINQATLFVEANAGREYDGATGWSDLTKNDIDFTYIGWQGNDEEKYTAAEPTLTISIDWTDGTTEDQALSNVLTLQDATIKNALAETHISIDKTKFSFAGTDNHNNYKIQGKSTGKLTIAKKTGLTLTFNAEITKDKGVTTTLDEVKAVLVTNAVAADQAAVKAAVTAFEIGTEADENGKYDITLTVNTAAAVFANYDMTEFEAGTGKIKYNNATLYISLKSASLSKLTKVYDGTEPDLTVISAADFDIDGWVAGEQTALTITAQFTTEGNHINVANYPVNFNVTGVPAGYDLEVSAATYKVTKRPIVFAIATQYLADEAIVSGENSVFDNSLFTVSKETNNPASGLADEADKAAFALDLQDNFKNGTDPVTFKANGATELIPLTKAIKVVVVDGALANNYSWTETFGVVNIAGGATLVLDEKADLTDVTTAAPVTITFANARTLKPKRWYAMCLPFETTVAKISQAFGYAIVDVLPENATGLNFKIAMGKIEAYRPFLVKIADAPGLEENDGDVNMNDGTKVKFTGVTIAAYNADANPYFVQEAGEHYFKGTMKWDTIGQTYWTTGDKMANDAFEFDGYAGTTKLKALRAYIVGKTSTTSAPMITIEEADGSTTAINCINADGEAIETNGWYTINGIKLQGVPTEKGIYIHNGKKLVVK